MARVVLAHSYGGPEVLAVEERALAAPGPGELTLEVRAAGINPVDWKLFGGQMGDDPDKLPRRVGFEAAGVVTAVGDGAEGPRGPIAVGDEVIAFRIMGAWADALVVPAASCVPKPASLGFEAAGGLMLTGATAVHLLEATGVGDGDTVLVHGAAGGVGRMAVQLARARGAEVIGTAGERNHELLRALGARPVSYGEGLEGRVRAVAPDGVDAALDCVGTDEAVEVSLAVVGDRDRIATIAAFERGAEAGIKRLGGGPGADPGTELRDRARLELIDAVAAGDLVVEARAFPLADVAEAVRTGQTGHADGKLVLVP